VSGGRTVGPTRHDCTDDSRSWQGGLVVCSVAGCDYELGVLGAAVRDLHHEELEALSGVFGPDGLTDAERSVFAGPDENDPAPVCAMPGCDELARSCSWCWTHCRATHRHPKPGEER
jgi:hypothetical protein